MTSKQLAILNSLVTFAAENVPGGLSPEETDVARVVGDWIRGYVAPDENKLFDYKVVKAGAGDSIELVANQWSKHGWRVVAAFPDIRQGLRETYLALERPGGDIRTEIIRLEVDLERIFHEASGAHPMDAGGLLNLIREIEQHHDKSP